jgi:hypothetical protein
MDGQAIRYTSAVGGKKCAPALEKNAQRRQPRSKDMSEVKKYDMDQTGCQIEDPDGRWVEATDNERLTREQGEGTTSNKYRAELYDEVWQRAREMGFENVTMALSELAALKAVPDGVFTFDHELCAQISNGWPDDAVELIETIPCEPLMPVAQHNARMAEKDAQMEKQYRLQRGRIDGLESELAKFRLKNDELRAALSAPAAGQKPIAYLSGTYRDVIEGKSDRVPLGAEISFVDMGWLGQIELYAKPVAGQDVSALVEALEFSCKALAQMTSADGSGHADVARAALRMAGIGADERDQWVESWKAGSPWRIDAALAAHKAGGEV